MNIHYYETMNNWIVIDLGGRPAAQQHSYCIRWHSQVDSWGYLSSIHIAKNAFNIFIRHLCLAQKCMMIVIEENYMIYSVASIHSFNILRSVISAAKPDVNIKLTLHLEIYIHIYIIIIMAWWYVMKTKQHNWLVKWRRCEPLSTPVEAASNQTKPSHSKLWRK